jgi:hypothetical protein
MLKICAFISDYEEYILHAKYLAHSSYFNNNLFILDSTLFTVCILIPKTVVVSWTFPKCDSFRVSFKCQFPFCNDSNTSRTARSRGQEATSH